MRKHLTFANVMSVAAVFIALGGTAVALKANSVGGKQIRNGAVKSSDIANETIRGKDLKSRSITSREIEEASLDIERFLSFESADGASCSPDAGFVACSTLDLDLSEPSQVLMVGDGEQYGDNADGLCRFSVGGSAVPGSTVEVGSPATLPATQPNGFGLNAIHPGAGTLAAGNHTISIECNETGGDVTFDTTLSVLAIGGVDGG